MISEALNTEAVSAAILGRQWTPLMDRALRIALVPVRLGRAEARWLEGRAADALREAEVADDTADTHDAWTYGAVAAWLRRTGSARPVRAELAEPYQHQVSGHWEKAAQLWTDLGCPYEAALTRREREILAEICAGQTNAAITAKLFISAKTVDHHVSAVLAELGAPNRNAAAARAAKLGLIN